MTANASLQGEHVFNALGDLANELAATLTRDLPPANPANTADRTAAQQAIGQLQRSATSLIRERNNADFRTAPSGDPANAGRYSGLVRDTRKAIGQIVRKQPAANNASLHTQGHNKLNQLLNHLDDYTIDAKAHDSARAEFSGSRQQQFDLWYNRTKGLMHTTFKLLINAALAVNRAYVKDLKQL